MENNIRGLEPKALWNNFADLNAVPRPSKKEERVIAFIQKYGESLGLETTKDEIGNVIIKKPASAGMENRETVALQSHLDMVHQKNADTNFDFLTQGIEMYVEGDWVKAKGTTLGADNGIGVATIMAILAAKDITHPPIEALFTIDEETGMTGALNLKGGLLKASIMLNLDTEDDHELTIGCAGGIDVTATGKYGEESTGSSLQGFTLNVKGLTGGHSGMEIHLGRANANKLMNRLLYQAANIHAAKISSIDGGSLRNAIPRESISEIGIPADKVDAFKKFIEDEAAVLKQEYNHTDPNLQLILFPLAEAKGKYLSADFQYKVLRSIYTCWNGVFRMSPDIPGLVQTSNNLSRVLVKDGAYSIQCLTRSSVNEDKMDLVCTIQSSFELLGATIQFGGNYPGWVPRPEAGIVKLMRDLYKKMFNEEPLVDACHAGLECGIIGANYPDMEMISFGPNIKGAHSPDETVQISSVQKFWGFLMEILKGIPVRR
jgi:dipeptidase D